MRSSRRIIQSIRGHRKPRRSDCAYDKVAAVLPEPPRRLSVNRPLPREDQFDSRNNQHCRETKRNYADRKTPTPQMRTDNAANNCRRCENESERRDGAYFCEVANQPGDRVYPDEQRRNCRGLSNVSPATKKQDRSEKNSASSSG